MTDDFQDNEVDSEDDGENRIELELWLQVLLAYKGDENEWRELVDEVAARSGLIPEKVDRTLDTLFQVLLNSTRSN